MLSGKAQSDNEKSYLDWIKYSLVLSILLPSVLAVILFFRYEEAWAIWLSMFLSRGIYIVLAILIFGCVLITCYKNKVGGVAEPQETKAAELWCCSKNLWKTPLLASCSDSTIRKSFSVEEACGSDATRQLLREAEARNEALKRELEELNKARLTLEERSGMLEREKAEAEERLEEAKLQSALESEDLRKVAAVTNRQLQQVMEEREMLSREVCSASRDGRITESALKDQARLTTRLDEAREELSRLKLQMEEIKVERDTAVAIAADLAVRAQGAADDSAQLIGQWVKREMENRKRKDARSTVSLVASEPEPVPEACDVQEENLLNEKVEMLQDPVEIRLTEAELDQDPRDDNEREEATEDKINVEMDMEGVTMMTWREDSQDELQTIGCGPVTSSAAFRDFLTANYSPMSL